MTPATFWIPTRAHRDALRVGDLAKLVFVPAFNLPAERMWVEVRRVVDGRYHGILRNTPVIVGLARGSELEFGPEHIADWERP